MLSYNCAQTPALGQYIHACARATLRTHVHYLYTRTCVVAHVQTCLVLYNSYGNTIRPAPLCPWLCPPP